jgi:hypothetical protein
MKKLFLALLLLPLVCFAENMVQVYPPQQVLRFKGLDDTSSLLTTEDGRALDLQNVDISISNALSKRDGYELVGAQINQQRGTAMFPAVTGLYYTKLSSGTEYRYAVCANKIYYDNSDTWTEIPLVPSQITYDKNNQFVWVTALDTAIFTNDTDVPLKAAGITVTALDVSDLSDTLTTVKCLAWFKNYLILGNTVEAGVERSTRFRWSNVGTIETFDDDNFIDIAALGGQEIEGFAALYDNLYMFLTDSIWKISLVGGNEIFIVSKVVDGIGCIAKNSIQNVNLLNQRKGLIFLTKDKRIYFFDGTTVADLSILIRDVMGDLRADRLPYAVSAYNGTNYYLAVTSGAANTTNNLLLDFQCEVGEWSKHTQIDANSMAQVVNSASLSKTHFGNYASFVYSLAANLDSDITGQSDGVASVYTNYDLPNGTATGLTIILTDTTIDYIATGATITLVSGTGVDQERVVVSHTTTGLVVDSAFTTTPDATTGFEIGAIDAFYETKWYDFGDASRRKLITKSYLWTEEAGGVDVNVEESIDFTSVLQTENVSLQGVGGLWGSAVWGTDVWGGQEALFHAVPLSGSGRFVKLRFANDDIDEDFSLLGFNFIYMPQDIQ